MPIKLKSSDAKVFDISEEACKKSSLLEKKISDGKTEIFLEDIKGEILEKIVEYLN